MDTAKCSPSSRVVTSIRVLASVAIAAPVASGMECSERISRDHKGNPLGFQPRIKTTGRPQREFTVELDLRFAASIGWEDKADHPCDSPTSSVRVDRPWPINAFVRFSLLR